MADRYLLESGSPDGYLLEDGSGVLLLDNTTLEIVNNANTTVTYQGEGVYAIEKTAGAASTFDAAAVSNVGLSGDFVLRIKPLVFINAFYNGVNSDPLTDNAQTGIDYGFAQNGNTTALIKESFTTIGSNRTLSTYWWIWRTSGTLGYGTGADLATAQASAFRTVASSATLYFDSSYSAVGERAEVFLYIPAPTVDYPLTADSGTFSYTGQDAAFRYGVNFGAAVGTFSYSGQASALTSARALTASQAAFSYSGQAASLPVSRILPSDAGAFAYSGQDANLTVGGFVGIEPDPGVFAYSGFSAEFRVARRASAEAGMFSLSSFSALLSAGLSFQKIAGPASAGTSSPPSPADATLAKNTSPTAVVVAVPSGADTPAFVKSSPPLPVDLN